MERIKLLNVCWWPSFLNMLCPRMAEVDSGNITVNFLGRPPHAQRPKDECSWLPNATVAWQMKGTGPNRACSVLWTHPSLRSGCCFWARGQAGFSSRQIERDWGISRYNYAASAWGLLQQLVRETSATQWFLVTLSTVVASLQTF